MIRAAVLVAATLLVLAIPARAQPGATTGVSDRLREAQEALQRGDYAAAEGLARPIVNDIDRVNAIDRAETYRVYGLALFFLQRLPDAEAALLAYLRLDPDAHLDPGRYPPEAIVFFEDIRARHRAELLGLRPRPRTVREWSKNLFPPWGQFANGDDTKGWVVGSAELLLLATHLTTFFVLDHWCDRNGTGVCTTPGGADRRDAASVLRAVNLVSGGALIAIYAYGVIDGFARHRHLAHRETSPEMSAGMSVGVSTTPGGGIATVGWRF